MTIYPEGGNGPTGPIPDLFALARQYTAQDWHNAHANARTESVARACLYLYRLRMDDPLVAPDDCTQPTDLPPAVPIPIHHVRRRT